MIIFFIIFLLTICQRLIELKIADGNERWMKEHGAKEVGQEHYKLFLIVHSLFFLSLFIEVIYLNNNEKLVFYSVFLLIFLLAQLLRIWCITSLGRFWNTKIIVFDNVVVIKKGPYKYLRHPNYVVVFIELLTLPLIFGAFATAFIFPFLHLLILTVRVPTEDAALGRSVK